MDFQPLLVQYQHMLKRETLYSRKRIVLNTNVLNICYIKFNVKKLQNFETLKFYILFHRDECVNFPIQKGLDASRSKIKFFRHNDCDHLEQLLAQQATEDKKVRK